MPPPLFSVVIPTINRIEPLKLSIESILAQECGDFECVIIDNNTDDRLDGLCESFDDGRLRRVKTGGLSMAANWDAALLAAQGQYVVLIEDKKCLYGHALLVARDIIEKTGTELLVWGGDVVNDKDPASIRIGTSWGSRQLRTISTDEILDEFTLRDISRLKSKVGFFPKAFAVGCLSVVSKSLLDKIRAQTGQPLCLPVNPDFTMGCHLVNHLSSYLLFDGSMTFVHSLQTSTGGNWHSQRKDVNNVWQTYGGQEIGYRHVPIKTIFIESQPFNDYLAMVELVGGRLAQHPINWTMYYIVMYEHNARNHREGFDRTEELKAWKDALNREPFALQRQVRWHLFRLALRRIFRKIRTKSGLRRLEQMLKGKREKSSAAPVRKIVDVRDFLKQETARLRQIDMKNLKLAPAKPLAADSNREAGSMPEQGELFSTQERMTPP